MKRIAIILSLIMGISYICFAQRDTVSAGYPFYFPSPLNYDSLQQDCITNYNRVCGIINASNGGGNANAHVTTFDSFPNRICDFMAIRYVPDTDIHIIGIAYGFGNWPFSQMLPREDTSTQVVMLFLPEADTLLLIDSVSELVIADSMRMQRLMDYDYSAAFSDSTLFKRYDIGHSIGDWWRNHMGWPAGHDSGYEAKYFGVKESYFQNEINLSQDDTFYLAATWRWHNCPGRLIPQNFTNQPLKDYTSVLSIPIFLPSMEYSLMDSNDVWYHGFTAEGLVPWLWAIVRRDCDTCPQVQGLEYVKTGYNRAFFRWQNGTNHRDWQLSYGPAGTAPEDGTIVDCSQRMTGNIEFDPDSHYVAYVRARCRFARYEYGPWSAPLDFCLNGSGIDEAGATDITLTPNPAAERVTVAAEGMESVELIGADGAVLQRRECRDACTLDLRGLAAGVYMVRVGTATGTRTARFVKR